MTVTWQSLEDEISAIEAQLEAYLEEVAGVLSVKEDLEDALEEVGSQLEGLAAETEDLRRGLRERTTQMWVVLGVAAIAAVAVFVVLVRNRSG